MNKTKKAIFNAAIKVFSIEGYDSATVDESLRNCIGHDSRHYGLEHRRSESPGVGATDGQTRPEYSFERHIYELRAADFKLKTLSLPAKRPS